jgi:hypothetical protein
MELWIEIKKDGSYGKIGVDLGGEPMGFDDALKEASSKKVIAPLFEVLDFHGMTEPEFLEKFLYAEVANGN